MYNIYNRLNSNLNNVVIEESKTRCIQELSRGKLHHAYYEMYKKNIDNLEEYIDEIGNIINTNHISEQKHINALKEELKKNRGKKTLLGMDKKLDAIKEYEEFINLILQTTYHNIEKVAADITEHCLISKSDIEKHELELRKIEKMDRFMKNYKIDNNYNIKSDLSDKKLGGIFEDFEDLVAQIEEKLNSMYSGEDKILFKHIKYIILNILSYYLYTTSEIEKKWKTIYNDIYTEIVYTHAGKKAGIEDNLDVEKIASLLIDCNNKRANNTANAIDYIIDGIYGVNINYMILSTFYKIYTDKGKEENMIKEG